MKKIKVAVIMGGKTPEHEISLISGREVVRHLNKNKYLPLPVMISRDGKVWKITPSKRLLTSSDPLELRGTNKELVVRESHELQGVGGMEDEKAEVVFIAMHGPYGEDGTIQGMLEMAGLKYTGSGVLASALGMDKVAFRKIMKSAKIPIPEYIVVKRKDSISGINKDIKGPWFIKPSAQGSSVGASVARNNKELRNSLRSAFKYGDIVLVDEYIKGREFTCGLLGNDNPEPLPVVEIIPKKGDFFDYDSKYMESGSEEIVPAKISLSLTKKIQGLAVRVHKELGCRGFSRVDFILKDNKYPVVLEINTIPGLTPMSLLPKSAKAAGYSYSKLLEKIIDYALQK